MPMIMCGMTIGTPVIGSIAGLLGFDWEELAGFAYNWWPSCLCGGWIVAVLIGGILIVAGAIGFLSSRSQTDSDKMETQS